jgi:FAD synthetase
MLPRAALQYPFIWQYIKTDSVPYCSLYDEGYTSLGKKSQTVRNPALRQEDGSYLPAYTLMDGSIERTGRKTSMDQLDTCKYYWT